MKLASWLPVGLAAALFAIPASGEVAAPVDEDEEEHSRVDEDEPEPREDEEEPPEAPADEELAEAERADPTPRVGSAGTEDAPPPPAATERQPAPEGDDQAAQAAAHFMSASGLFEEGNLEAALAEFRASYSLRPHPAVLYNVGLIERSLHRYVDSAETLRRYLVHAPLYGEPEERRAEIQEILGELEAVIALLTIDVDQDGARVLVEGESVGTTPLGEALRLEAGQHTVEVRMEGFENHSESVELHGREERRLSIELEPLARRPWYQQWWVWTAVGVAVAGVAVAVALPLTVAPTEANFGPVEIRGGD